MNTKDIQIIQENFTHEAIHYYYDVVYGPEGLGEINRERSEKYVKEIKYCLLGKVNDEKLALVKKIFDSLRELTSLKISYTANEKVSNFLIFFVDRDQVTLLDTDTKGAKIKKKIPLNIRGMAKNKVNKKGSIVNSSVIIPNDLPQKAMPHVLLEEITQALGLGSDSYKYLNSIFYEGESYVDRLSDLDKQVIRLHYTPNIKEGLTKTAFYDAFKDVLKTKTRQEQLSDLENFIIELNPSKEAIELFCQFAFSKPNKFINEEHIQKFRTNEIFAKGIDNPIIDSVFSFLKKEIPYIRFKKLEDEHIETFNLSYTTFDNIDTLRISNFNRYWNKIIDYELYKSYVFYNDLNASKANNKIIIRNTLSALGLNLGRKSKYTKYSNLLSNNESSTKIFSRYDSEFLKIFLHPSLKSGMTKKEIYKIFKRHYNQIYIENSYKPYEKLETHLKEIKFSENAKSMLHENMLVDTILTKWENNSDIIYRIKNELTANDLAFLNNVIRKFDKKMEGVNFIESSIDMPDEVIDMEINYGYGGNIEKTCGLGGLIYQDAYSNTKKIFKINIQASHKDAIKRNKCLLDNFFKMVLDLNQIDKKLYGHVTETSFEFTDLGNEILQFYYHPTIQNGMQRKKILDALQKACKPLSP